MSLGFSFFTSSAGGGTGDNVSTLITIGCDTASKLPANRSVSNKDCINFNIVYLGMLHFA